ncbi:MAG: methyltransferase domain-containing protein [Clostridia bacterium]|nr:methyltransferase domain-containing protein [Clostridia bacterium]
MTCGNYASKAGEGSAGSAVGGSGSVGSVGHFNQIAEEWARLATIPDGVGEAALDALDLSAGSCVLDAGCGTGPLFAALLDRIGPDGRAVGLDPARRMLAIAARRLRDPRLRLVCLHIGEYDGRDGPFDGILCCRTLHHLPDPDATVARMTGWLRPGGCLAVLHETDAAVPDVSDAPVAGHTESNEENAVRMIRAAMERAGLEHIRESRPAAGWRLFAGGSPDANPTDRC